MFRNPTAKKRKPQCLNAYTRRLAIFLRKNRLLFLSDYVGMIIKGSDEVESSINICFIPNRQNIFKIASEKIHEAGVV